MTGNTLRLKHSLSGHVRFFGPWIVCFFEYSLRIYEQEDSTDILGVDSPFFSTIVLFKNRLFP